MKHFEPKEAYEFLEKNPNTIFVDCRSEMEYLFVGHPIDRLSPVPFLRRCGTAWHRPTRRVVRPWLAPRPAAILK